MKYTTTIRTIITNHVAPFAGAWIEIAIDRSSSPTGASLPSRERGLKYIGKGDKSHEELVAPFAGAWIEIFAYNVGNIDQLVAPFAGAWIEIMMKGTNGIPQLRRSLRGSVD